RTTTTLRYLSFFSSPSQSSRGCATWCCLSPLNANGRCDEGVRGSSILSAHSSPSLTSGDAPAGSLDEEARLRAARAVRRADARLCRLQRGDGRRRQAGDCAVRGTVRACGREASGLQTLGGARDAD